MAHIRKLIVDSIYNIPTMGTVWSINLRINGISSERKEWHKDNIEVRNGGGYVMCEDKFGQDIYQIIGIEAFAAGEGFNHNQIGLLVKKLDNYAG